MKKVVLTRVSRGNSKGQFLFTFFASNGKDIGGSRPESYHNKQDAIDTLTNNFPDWPVVDKSDEDDPHVILIDDVDDVTPDIVIES